MYFAAIRNPAAAPAAPRSSGAATVEGFQPNARQTSAGPHEADSATPRLFDTPIHQSRHARLMAVPVIRIQMAALRAAAPAMPAAKLLRLSCEVNATNVTVDTALAIVAFKADLTRPVPISAAPQIGMTDPKAIATASHRATSADASHWGPYSKRIAGSARKTSAPAKEPLRAVT